MKQKTAIVLAGLKIHSILINKLKQRGYHTILVDYLDNPPAARVADEHIQISTFDVDAIRELARTRQADMIINCCIEHINNGIAQIAEDLDLPMLYSYETAINVSDKERMKRIMIDNDIPTTQYVTVRSVDELDSIGLKFPLFVKPADGSGSTGVNRAKTPEELKKFTQLAIDFSRKKKAAIVEEEAVGKECNVYCVIQNGKATVMTLSEKYSEIGGEGKVTKAIGSLWPALVSEKALENMKTAAQKIADAFRLDTTPMFMQLMVNGDDINIIEFACRMAGGYSYQNILNKYGFDYFDFTIDAFEGIETDISKNDNGLVCAIHSLYALPCIFDRAEGLKELKESGEIADYMIARDSGTQITEVSANREKFGFFIVQAESVPQVLEKVQSVFDRIEAYDTEGNKVLRRDLILNSDMLR